MREFAAYFIRAVMICQSGGVVIGLADVKPAGRILKNVHPKHEVEIGSGPDSESGRICNHTANPDELGLNPLNWLQR